MGSKRYQLLTPNEINNIWENIGIAAGKLNMQLLPGLEKEWNDKELKEAKEISEEITSLLQKLNDHVIGNVLKDGKA